MIVRPPPPHYKAYNNDDVIINCAKTYQNNDNKTYIVSEDKTFKIKFNNTLSVAEFFEKFENYSSNIPNATTKKLLKAIETKNIKEIEYLLEHSSDLKINAYSDCGFTPLILLIKMKNINLVKKLLTLPYVDLHKCDNSYLKMTPLAHAVQNDLVGMVKILLQYGAKAYIGNVGKNRSNTPFLMACWDNRKNALLILEELLQHQVSINQVDGNGYSGLIKACIKGHFSIASYLLSKGADMQIRDFKNKNALEHALENNHKNIVSLLEKWNKNAR